MIVFLIFGLKIISFLTGLLSIIIMLSSCLMLLCVSGYVMYVPLRCLAVQTWCCLSQRRFFQWGMTCESVVLAKQQLQVIILGKINHKQKRWTNLIKQQWYNSEQQFLMSSNDPHKQTITEMVDRVLNEKESWSKHIAHTCCRCEKCTCGKHLCKFQPLKMNLKHQNTTYHDSYDRKQAPYGLSESHKKLNIPIDVYHPRQFIEKSQYQEEYIRKKARKQKVVRAEKRPDNLELGGPAFCETTYKDSYVPKYAPPPDPIKNPQNLGNSRSRMNATSSYRNNYNWSQRKPIKREQPIKPSGNLKTNSGVFYGQSSYGHDYHKYKDSEKDKDRDNFAPRNKYQPQKGLRPASSYRCDYTGRRAEQCPALRCPAQRCC